MIQLQVLNRVLDKGFSIIEANKLTEDHFSEYRDEYKFICEHVAKYRNVPDKETMGEKFPEFEFITVRETDKYLIDALEEDLLYRRSVAVLMELEKKLRVNSNDAVKYLLEQLPNLQPRTAAVGEDLVASALSRGTSTVQRAQRSKLVIHTGFQELDDIFEGFSPGEDLCTIVGRPGQGKTWILMKMLIAAFQQGRNVGLYSGEMSVQKISYRADTLLSGISNHEITRATFQEDNEEAYQHFLQELAKHSNRFVVCTPRDFGHKAEVEDLKQFCKQHQLDILGIDHYMLMQDQRWARNRTERLENIVQDLWDLTCEIGIPIIALSQANRGAGKADAPDLDNIFGSDAIAQYSSRVIGVRQTEHGVEMSIRKNRDDATGQKLCYWWDIDKGEFKYLPTDQPQDRKKVERAKREFQDKEDVF